MFKDLKNWDLPVAVVWFAEWWGGVVGLAKVKSSSSGSTRKGVEVKRGWMFWSSAGIWNAKLELDVPEN